MATEIIKEDGKIVDVKVNGKPVKRGSIRGLKKAQETFYFEEYTESEDFQNPWSGETYTLTPIEATIYAWCQRWYSRYSAKTT